MVAKLVVLFVVIGMSCAAVWRGRLPVKPEEFADKEGCYVKEINDVISFGESVEPIGYCYRISCGKHMMDYASCGVVGMSEDMEEKCHVTSEDYSKPYPACCPNIKCDFDNNII